MQKIYLFFPKLKLMQGDLNNNHSHSPAFSYMLPERRYWGQWCGHFRSGYQHVNNVICTKSFSIMVKSKQISWSGSKEFESNHGNTVTFSRILEINKVWGRGNSLKTEMAELGCFYMRENWTYMCMYLCVHMIVCVCVLGITVAQQLSHRIGLL